MDIDKERAAMFAAYSLCISAGGRMSPNEIADVLLRTAALASQGTAPPAAVPAPDSDVVNVCKEDANNYCRILTLLGMEEEGDPVAEVERLVAAAAAPAQAVDSMRYTSDGALAECPCCGSLDVGGAHNTVHCYACDLTIKRVGPLQNAIDAWNRRTRAALAAQPAAHTDDIAVDRFAVAMKEKMATSRAKGRGGWDDPAQCRVEKLAAMLMQHIEKGDPVDVGNFCMMIWNRVRFIGPDTYAPIVEAFTSYMKLAAPTGEPVAWTNERCEYEVCDEDETHDPRCTAWKDAAPAANAGQAQAVAVPEAKCNCRRCIDERGDTVGEPPHEWPRLMCEMILCSTCGNKRCPHANDHRNPCTGSNEPGQPGSAYPAAPLPQQVAQTEAKPFPTSRDAYGKMTPEQKQRLDADLYQLGQRIDEHRRSRDRRTHSEVVEFDRRKGDRRHNERRDAED